MDGLERGMYWKKVHLETRCNTEMLCYRGRDVLEREKGSYYRKRPVIGWYYQFAALNLRNYTSE